MNCVRAERRALAFAVGGRRERVAFFFGGGGLFYYFSVGIGAHHASMAGCSRPLVDRSRPCSTCPLGGWWCPAAACSAGGEGLAASSHCRRLLLSSPALWSSCNCRPFSSERCIVCERASVLFCFLLLFSFPLPRHGKAASPSGMRWSRAYGKGQKSRAWLSDAAATTARFGGWVILLFYSGGIVLVWLL